MISSEFSAPRAKSLLLDSNLYVVVVVGKTHRSLLGHGPAKDYTVHDFKRLVALIEEYQSIVTTPQILSEVNSLLNKSGYARNRCRAMLATQIPLLDERLIPSQSVCGNPSFPYFGLTDLSIREAATDDTLVLSADWPLVGYLRKAGIAALHYRELTA